jgi:hypothetical protein
LTPKTTPQNPTINRTNTFILSTIPQNNYVIVKLQKISIPI